MSFTRDLLTGVAERLHAEGAAAWKPTTPYVATDTAIVLKGMPAKPDRCVVLTAYDVDSPYGEHVVQGVQVRCRGTTHPLDVDDLADAVRDALHGLTHVELHGIAVGSVRRSSHASLGPDTNGRYETSSNFYVLAARPAPALPA